MSELRAGPGLRVARGLVAAIVATGLGLLAHSGAGGLLPSAPWLAFIFVAVAAVAVASLGVPAGLLRVVALVAGGQFVTHLMLTALAGHAGDHQTSRAATSTTPSPKSSMAAAGSSRRGSLYDLTMPQAGDGPGDGVATPHWLTHVVDDLTGPHALMAFAHLVAAVVVACWLTLGERTLWRLIMLLGTTVGRTLGCLTPVGMPAVFAARVGLAPEWRDGIQRPRDPLTGGAARRGPPLVVI